MRTITREHRAAFMTMLADLDYKGVTIPVRDSMIATRGAEVPLQGDKNFESYILITNQYRSSNGLKNALNSNATLTIDINTVFSGSSFNMAGSQWAEEIANLVFDRLYIDYQFRLLEFGVDNDRYVVTSNSNYIQPMPLQYTDTSRVFRVVIVIENGIQYLKSDSVTDTPWVRAI